VVFFDKDLTSLSRRILAVYRFVGLVRVVETSKDGLVCYESSNFTLINYYLVKMGPTGEGKLTNQLLIIQVGDVPLSLGFIFFIWTFIY